jgi:enoyl-CoA hydratase/carnithine racemase
MGKLLLKEVKDGVAVLTLNRPDRLNAWTPELEREYFAGLAECAAAEEVRAIVVTGAGRGFCAGADMQSLQDVGEHGISLGDIEAEHVPQSYPHTIPKPVIAAINGPCAGIGLVQALMCDIRFVAEDAKLTTAFARRGLVAEHGISWIMPRLVGPAIALDLLMSGRVILGAEAAELGLANKALPGEQLLEHTLSYARELVVNCAPSSMATMKAQVYTDLEQELAPAIAEADRQMLRSLGEADFIEGVSSFVERREPKFAPLASETGALAG